MDFTLSDDEAALAHGVRDLCSGRFPMERVRGFESQGGVDRSAWAELAESGVFSLRLPEAKGGAGLGAVHSVLVFEELGRALVPGPLVWSHLAADLVEGAASGEAVVGGVALPPGAREGPVLVEQFESLDRLVVLDEGGVWSVDPSTPSATPAGHPLDPLTPLHAVTGLERGERLAGAETAERWNLEGAVLVAAFLLGVAEALTDLAVSYAKEREQFDRPIGSFQAVKHILADMLVRTEVARSAVYAAGVTLDDPEVGDGCRAASGAKLLAGEAALVNGKACIQVHGGMGFTWEVDAHLYLKRARVLDTVFGSVDDHAEALAACV